MSLKEDVGMRGLRPIMRAYWVESLDIKVRDTAARAPRLRLGSRGVEPAR